jgi:ribonucleoside-diphosphate reductase alpha chain
MEKSKTFSNDFDDEMLVKKRNGELETVAFDKILRRIRTIGTEVGIKINYTTLAMKVIDQLYNGISTTKIDELSAQQCASLASTHPDYNVLAGRITISNHHKNTSSSFVDVMTSLYEYKDTHGKSSPLVSDLLYEVVQKYKDEWDNILDYQCDYLIDYFGFKTLERAYLMQINKVTVERPQHMWLRVSIGIHGDNLAQIRKTYEYMSQKYFTHATPTLFNAGTPHPQLSSCFLLAMEKDSIEGIYNTLKDCALISKWAGGIGLHIHNIRASGSHIRGTNGSSNGIVPMLKVFNNTAKYVDQCLDPDTIVYTKRGPIKIKNIVIGDKVIADDGNYYPIGKVLDNEYLGDLYTLDVKHTLYPLKLTDMHPLWTIKNDKCYQRNFDDVINQLDRNLLVPQFIEVKNISKNDFIGFPIPKYEKDIPQYTEDDCRFYGILLGDGNISISKNIAYVALNKETKQDTIEFVENYLQKINAHITYTYQNDKYVRLTWSRNNMFKFTYEMLYDNNKEKFVMPSMLHLSKPKILQIIKGILETDGKVKDYQIVLELTSNNIVESVRYMLLRLGILCSGTMRDRRNENYITKYNCFIQNKKISYILIVPKKPIICDLFKHKNISPSESFTFFEYEDYLFSIVDGNTFVKDYSGRVIDIEVDNDDHHNFLTHNGLVKNGGGKRNGSFAIYLEPWHADIELFLQMRKNHGDEELKARDLFYALWVPDLFMERIKTDGKWTLMCPDECPGLADVYGDDFANLYMKYEANGKGKKTVKARDLWFQILDAQMETGTPYLLYKDACNKKSNQKNVGTIKSSNLCVAPETQILTENGYFEIQSLHNQRVNIWNGEEFSEVTIHKTGENQELIDVYTNDGCKLTCTKYHKFFIQSKYNKSKINKNIAIVEAQNLKEGDKIIKCDYPIIDNGKEMKYAYTHGFFCGDGTYNNCNQEEIRCKYKSLVGHSYCKRHIDFENEENPNEIQTETTNYICNANSYSKKPCVSLYGEKKDLLKHLNFRSFGEVDETCDKLNVQLPLDIEEKFYVPQNLSLKTKLEWFAGYCDADGCISRNGDNQQLQASSINEEFLLKIKFMLQTCGINPKVTKMRGETKTLLPDSNRELRYYECKPIYRLLITSNDLQKLSAIGFTPKRLEIKVHKPNRNANQFIKIKSIENTGRIDDTYCFNEPKKHAGIFNGIITSQCTEILEYSDENETAVCNLASIGLPTFVDRTTTPPTFNYEKLHEISRIVTYNLNRIIDVNYYPTPKTERSNKRHRPIGIGVQGLADVFMMMNLPFSSDEAKMMNKMIFETIYHGALTESCNIAKIEGKYETFDGSPASHCELQFDLWNVEPCTNRYAWTNLKNEIKEHGLRNSLLLAPMPTASTSQILGFNECIEPITSNIYSRRTIAGEFILANKYLMNDLIALDLWNEKIKNNIIANHGSIQHLEMIPPEIKEKYKTVWEIPMRNLIDMAADRGAYICQSQSLNLWLEDPNYSNLTSMHFYSWSKGLKTGIYYLRRRGRHQAQQFTIEPEKKENSGTMEEDEICEMCSA